MKNLNKKVDNTFIDGPFWIGVKSREIYELIKKSLIKILNK